MKYASFVLVVQVLLVGLATTVSTVSGTCAEAYSNVDYCAGLYIGSGITMEQLMTDVCPEECQVLLTAAISNCTVGTSNYLESDIVDLSAIVYEEAVLVRENTYMKTATCKCCSDSHCWPTTSHVSSLLPFLVRQFLPEIRVSVVEVVRLWLHAHCVRRGPGSSG